MEKGGGEERGFKRIQKDFFEKTRGNREKIGERSSRL